MTFLDGRCWAAGVRKWARNARSALGLGRNMHTPTNTVHTSHTSGKTSGRESCAGLDEFVSSSEPSVHQNAQIRAWEQRTDHPRFQRSLCSNRLCFASFALYPSSLPTTTTTPYKLAHLIYLTRLSLKWLALRYVHPLRQILEEYATYQCLMTSLSSSSLLIANRPQVYRRLVDSITYKTFSTTYTHLFSRVLGKAPRKQLATKAARKTAVVSVPSLFIGPSSTTTPYDSY